MQIEFTVPGEPVAQARPRFSTRNGFPRAYDKAESRNYKAWVRTVAAQYKPDTPITDPISLELRIYRSIPKSFSKKKHTEAVAGVLRPITKPDCDNYCKIAMDSLNGIIWADDAQVVNMSVSKWYSDEPRIEIKVTTPYSLLG